MGDGLLTKKCQIAFEEESVEGTAETLVAADATMEIDGIPEFSANLERHRRDPARATLSQLAGIVGKQGAGLNFRTVLKGSGAVGTEPAWDDALRCCGFAKSTVSSIAIGAVSSGPFEPGELITGGTSSATGRVVGEVRNGAAALSYVVVSGVFEDAEVITGGTSGASATSSAGPAADKGFEYRPVSSSVPSGTAALYRDGLKKLLYGVRGNVSLEARLGQPAVLAFSFAGVYGGVTDVALLGSVPYESTVPVAFLNSQGIVQGLEAIYTELMIDMQNTLAPRDSARAEKGILSVLLTERFPQATIDPEMELVADHDFYGKLASGATGRLYSELPGSAGEKITIAAPRCVYSEVGEGERNSIAVARIGLDLVTAAATAGDDELQIAML